MYPNSIVYTEDEKKKDADRIIYQRDNVLIKGFSDGYLWVTTFCESVKTTIKARLTREDALDIFNWLGLYLNEFQLNDGTWLNDYKHPEVKK